VIKYDEQKGFQMRSDLQDLIAFRTAVCAAILSEKL
jgi:hypothetical protein